MAMKKTDMVRQCMDAIEKHKLVFIDDVMAYVPFCRSTFYAKGLDKTDNIKSALENNKIKMKQGMKAKWYKSDNATLQVALYKLIGSEEEAHRLNGSHQKVDTNVVVTKKIGFGKKGE